MAEHHSFGKDHELGKAEIDVSRIWMQLGLHNILISRSGAIFSLLCLVRTSTSTSIVQVLSASSSTGPLAQDSDQGHRSKLVYQGEQRVFERVRKEIVLKGLG